MTSSDIPACSVPKTSANGPRVESLGRHILAVGCRRHDAVPVPAQCGERFGGSGMAPHVNPLVGAAGDIGIGIESAECLDGVHLL